MSIQINLFGDVGDTLADALLASRDKRANLAGTFVKELTVTKLGIFETKTKHQDFLLKYRIIYPHENAMYVDKEVTESRQIGGPVKVNDKPYRFEGD